MTAPALDVFACPLQGTQLIEASAGTGKTWNICGLVLRLLLERRLEVQGILVVTFTKAATAELHERIRSRIVMTLAALRGNAAALSDPFVSALLQGARQQHGLADDDMALRLDLALQSFDEASIFTIHGFCQRALADAPFTAGMPMVQTLLEDDRELVLQVVTDFWRQHIAGAPLSTELAAYLFEQGDSPAGLARLLARRLAKPLSKLLWPQELDAAAPDAPFDCTPLAQAWATARGLWLADRAAIVARVHDTLPRLNNNVYKPASLDSAASSWDALFDDTSRLPSTETRPRLNLLGSTRLQPKKNQAPVPPHAFFSAAQAWLDEHTRLRTQLAEARLRLLRALLIHGPTALRAAKRERRVQAFDDMLFNLHQRLTGPDGPALAQALRARFPAALIDEFQDTDPLQFTIFSTLYAGSQAPLFLVGDPKQAIYSFRHADLHTYLQARQQTTAEYTLAENQRSTPALLAALNALFSANPRAFMLAGLDYPPVSSGAKQRALLVDDTLPRLALQLWQLPTAANGTLLSKPAAKQAAAEACAGEIARLLQAGLQGRITLDGSSLQAGDMAVLVRSHAQGTLMRQALAALGVGSVEHSQASVYASSDALELAQVLRGVLEPAREPVLRAALATALLGGDATALQALTDDEPATLAAVQRYSDYRQSWQQRGVGVMLRQWMAAEHVYPRLLARPDGERRLTNLLHLAECLHEAAQVHPAPDALCRWLQAECTDARTHSGSASSRNEAAQLRLASDRNLVQIVTIHKSKGLEYPFVFCPFLWDGHPGMSSNDGDGIDYHDSSGQPVLDLRTLDKPQVLAIKAGLALERAAENLRLVYVALTRAVHRCHGVVGLYGKGASLSTTEACRGPLSWLVAGAGHEPAAWLKKPVAAPALQAAWAALAMAEAPHMALDPWPTGPHAAVPPQRAAPESVSALHPPQHIDAGWAIGSYSSLAQGARHEAAALDHDLRLQPVSENAPGPETRPGFAADEVVGAGGRPSPQPSPASGRGSDTAAAPEQAALPPLPLAGVQSGSLLPLPLAGESWDEGVGSAHDDILRFPRGPVAGECLHAVFEHIDFTQPATWPAAVASALRAHPPTWNDATAAPRGPAMLQSMLTDVLHTPLPGGAVLAQVPPARCLVELEFDLPVRHLGAATLALALRQHGYATPTLTFNTLRGHLRGFIDLVFEHGGRFYVLDWKSNHLGDSADDYAPASLARAMDRQGYHLQYLLYCVAVHRHLALRLPGYDFGHHFGGVLYLFVRGVRPHWPGRGVFAHCPAQATVEHLSALLDGTHAP